MKEILLLILIGPLFLSQNFQTKDSLKILAKSNFKSMEIFEYESGKLESKRKYFYNKSSNEITIVNVSDKNKEWLKTIVRLDQDYNIKEEEKIVEGTAISEKENILVKKQLSMIRRYYSTINTCEIETYDSNGKLSKKEFRLLNDDNQIIENIVLLNIPNNIVISEVHRYYWINKKSYKYEKLTFNAPKSKIIGVYRLNQYGDIESFKGNLYINNTQEDASFDFDKKIKKFDSKGNLIQVYKIDNKVQTLIEERKIIY